MKMSWATRLPPPSGEPEAASIAAHVLTDSTILPPVKIALLKRSIVGLVDAGGPSEAEMAIAGFGESPTLILEPYERAGLRIVQAFSAMGRGLASAAVQIPAFEFGRQSAGCRRIG